MKNKRMMALTAVLALALSACSNGGGGGTEETGSAAAGGDPNAIITAYGTEPQDPLQPANTGEVGGGRIVELLFSGLVNYDESGQPVNELAESIETEDAQNYTIKIKSGTKFTNGEEVTAKSFVDAWNFAANAANAQQNAYFFESIEGYADVSNTKVTGQDAAGKDVIEPDPLAQTMSGLTVVDDTTFTVKLSQPESDFPIRLGYSAFMPLPSAAIADPETYGENPVGNGPYMMETGGWQHDVQVALVKNPDYTGEREAQNGGVTFKFYTDAGPAYTDIQAGNLDVTDSIPANALRTYETDLQGRAANKAVAANATLNIPVYLPEWSGEAGKLRRQAVSYAINREEITKVVFNGTRVPAKDFGAQSIAGFSEDIPGNEILTFDEGKAKELWAEADAIQPWDASKVFTIAYNTDGAGNKEWVDAVANGLENVLGIQVEGKPYPTFAGMLDDREAKRLDGAVRAGWQFDYPSLFNGLGPVYGTGAGSNYEGYSNPEFDALLKEGLGAKSTEEGLKKFQEAEAILFEDLPNIPLWETSRQAGWSERIDNVKIAWNGILLYEEMTAK